MKYTHTRRTLLSYDDTQYFESMFDYRIQLFVRSHIADSLSYSIFYKNIYNVEIYQSLYAESLEKY
jgi:hypothetical protein